jgi:hypothetical protein
MNKILLVLGITGTFFLGFIVIGISVMGDRNCSIQIQNSGKEQLILKTFRYTNYDKTLTVDSVALRQNETLEIGKCISCSVPGSSDIDFDVIGIYDVKGDFKMMNREELIKYLETKDKDDCITYIVP